jgi:hypothetical protein
MKDSTLFRGLHKQKDATNASGSSLMLAATTEWLAMFCSVDSCDKHQTTPEIASTHHQRLFCGNHDTLLLFALEVLLLTI